MKTVFNVVIFDLVFSLLLLHIYLFRLATWRSVSHGVFHSFTDYPYGFVCAYI